MHTLTPGGWYLRFACVRCRTKQVLFPDLSKGTASIGAIYEVTCRTCGYKDHYDTDTIERYQHPENAQPVFSN